MCPSWQNFSLGFFQIQNFLLFRCWVFSALFLAVYLLVHWVLDGSSGFFFFKKFVYLKLMESNRGIFS